MMSDNLSDPFGNASASQMEGRRSTLENRQSEEFSEHLDMNPQAESSQAAQSAPTHDIADQMRERITTLQKQASDLSRDDLRSRARDIMTDLDSHSENMMSQQYEPMGMELLALWNRPVQSAVGIPPTWSEAALQSPRTAAQTEHAAQIRNQFAAFDPANRQQHQQIQQAAVQAYQHPDASPESLLPAYESYRATESHAYHHPDGISGLLSRVADNFGQRGPTRRSVSRALDVTRDGPNALSMAATLREHTPTLNSYARHENHSVGGRVGPDAGGIVIELRRHSLTNNPGNLGGDDTQEGSEPVRDSVAP